MSKRGRIRILLVVAALLASIAIIVSFFHRTNIEPLDPDIVARSKEYIRTLGSEPTDKLSTEQKLLLLHSQYNVGNYAATILIGESMIPELQALPPERQKMFVSMVAEACRRSGRAERGIEFAKQFR